MLQASRLAVVSLLLLMQLFAPLVHAHVGGGPLTGAVHLPGLEFLAQPAASEASASYGLNDEAELIVGLAPAVENPPATAPPAPDAELALIAYFLAIATPVSSLDGHPLHLQLSPQPCWLKPSPRAPPLV